MLVTIKCFLSARSYKHVSEYEEQGIFNRNPLVFLIDCSTNQNVTHSQYYVFVSVTYSESLDSSLPYKLLFQNLQLLGYSVIRCQDALPL